MFETVESIKQYGVLVPAIIRKKENGNYEMVSGHRRKRACELVGINKMPCIIKELTDDEATIIMVDANLQREQILPSERAFAYKLKLEAEKHQGKKTCGQNDHKSRDNISDSMSGRQVQRYIRLTYLIPQLLELVDNHIIKDKTKQEMALLPATEISYLTEEEQNDLLDVIEYLQVTPSHAQTRIMRAKSEKGQLNYEEINKILSQEKPNQISKIKLNEERFDKILPKNLKSAKEKEDYIYHCVIETIKRENKKYDDYEIEL